jgi:hypothetical protein
LTFLTAGLLHDAIPHHHGAVDNHGNDTDSAIWATLHSAVQHDQKQFLVIFTESLLVAVISAISITLFQFFTPLFDPDTLVLNPYAGDRLRRGIVPHRKFR